MKAVLTLVGLGLIVVLVIVVAVQLWKSDGKGCEEGGPGCHCCPFPCEHNRGREIK